MSEIKCRCGKALKANMEIEYSLWVNEFFCSPDCATDRYFEYMESTPVDFENALPEGIEINSDGVLVKDAEQCVYTDPPSALVSAADSTNTAGG